MDGTVLANTKGITVNYKLNAVETTPIPVLLPGIKEIIFDPPATIVYWQDGTKTVVKADQSAKKKKDRDKFREDYGLAMAIARKYFGGRKEFKDAVENGKHCK